jgi:hypothetical protein
LIFAKTRYAYDSYQDFWKLVELAGFETCWIDHIDWEQEAFYVTTPINGETRPVIERERKSGKVKRCKVAWWNLERPDSGPGGLNQLLGTMVCNDTTGMLAWMDYIWTSDKYQHTLDPRAVHVVMGSDARMALPGTRIPGQYDFCHLSYLSDRRRAMMLGLVRYRIAPNAWEPDRGKIINRSRFMLNLHQTEAKIGEPLRFAVAAAYACPLLTETCGDPFPMEPGRHMLMTNYDKIQRAVEDAMHQDMEPYGKELHNLYCKQLPFKECVLQGLQDSLNR